VDHANELKNHRAKEALLTHNIYNSCEINSCADLPSNTGLGSSGSFLVGLLNCIRTSKRINSEPKILAEEACDIEINKLNEPVGKQDQYIASYGGIKILNINKEGSVDVQDLNLKESTIHRLISNFCVYYLNIKRDASDVLKDQQQLKGNSEDILKTIKQHGLKTIEYLKLGDLDAYGCLLDEYWQLKKQLSNKINLEVVDNIYNLAKSNFNVLGGKIIGAGGGGFLLLYCSQKQNQLDSFMQKNGFQRLYFNLETQGSIILGNFTNK
jgi:D-glycero-alpha-D-manno-heptose-7-phosphate kinase